ncbi:porin [Cupriavidus numazuensis]|uniref:Porin domain-containing protein n=1 Tax=Cupriavidus numazuensis TaxID=221992 RepID=A0ABM8TRM7_9BURK|nr:porin [Cupriavidus numazuensis]CAG2158888.1 hypothetical protein LMG26411_06274 [Cupriavidus numazuensis]
MRRIVLSWAASTAICASGQAAASVTIYGNIDSGITYVNNLGGHSTVQMQDGISRANALGFSGVEDLGGGVSALLKLENGYSSDTGTLGQGGLLFGRQAYVGLGDKELGRLTLGRQYDSTVLMIPYFPCWNCGIYSAQNANLDRGAGERLNNAVQYRSTNLGGLTFGATYAFGEAAGVLTTNQGRAISTDVQYNNDDFSAIAVMTDINGAIIRAGRLGVSTMLGVPVQSSTILTADKQRIFGVGVKYKLGAWTPSILYTNTLLKLGHASSSDQVLRIGTTYQVSPSVLMAGQLSTDRFEQSRWYMANFSVDYFLSKRTDVYLELAAQRASGPGTVASIYLIGASSSQNQFLSRIGMKHIF